MNVVIHCSEKRAIGSKLFVSASDRSIHHRQHGLNSAAELHSGNRLLVAKMQNKFLDDLEHLQHHSIESSLSITKIDS
jgi:hypothetical protein